LIQTRAQLLKQISQILSQRTGSTVFYGDIPTLRSAYPGLPKRLTVDVLECLAKAAQTADLEALRTPLKPQRKPMPRKLTASEVEIRAMHKAGMSMAEIGRRVGCSRERVRQIVKAPYFSPKKEASPTSHKSILENNLTMGVGEAIL
jgi:DNA-binding NarL/FixJ family response regulator